MIVIPRLIELCLAQDSGVRRHTVCSWKHPLRMRVIAEQRARTVIIIQCHRERVAERNNFESFEFE